MRALDDTQIAYEKTKEPSLRAYPDIKGFPGQRLHRRPHWPGCAAEELGLQDQIAVVGTSLPS